MQEGKKNPRSTAVILDIIHIVTGLLVTICTILAFVNPEQNRIMFPVIFALAAFLNGVNGCVRLKNSRRNTKMKIAGIAQCAGAAVLLVFCVVSMVSIWR